jgi:1-acyl-sn-glycerol-3-phosphate acyltransferase
MTEQVPTLQYPRRQFIRGSLRRLIRAALHSLADVEISGRENLPKSGPLLVVGNHFSFLDPVAVIDATPWPLEFIGSPRRPNAPGIVGWFADVWGILPVYRGTASRGALLASQKVLNLGGVLGVFPEGGSWATVLRPARPGAAFLASRSQARLLPIGLDGLLEVFPKARRGKRAKVHIHFGTPFGPFYVSERGETNRQRLEEIGNEIMRRIAELIPPERRGHYSDDPSIRAAAKGTEIYPWAGIAEL